MKKSVNRHRAKRRQRKLRELSWLIALKNQWSSDRVLTSEMMVRALAEEILQSAFKGVAK